ncbi:hypothetical protein RKD19_006718 [Streptomyces canus]
MLAVDPDDRAESGPDCSTVTVETAPSKRSVLTEPWSSSSISGWRISTSRPFLAISVDPRVTDLMRVAPDLPIFAVMTPVETVIVPPLWSTVTFLSGTAASPAVSDSLPLPEATAWAVHLSEPSGQYAIGQDCTGTALPSASWTANR